MKLREVAALLGWRARPRRYGTIVRTFELPREGTVRYAQWQHPGERPKDIRQDAVDALRAYLRPGDVAIDIGAHSGDTALPLALAVGPTGAVLALEPNPYVFPVLEQNATLNPEKTRIIPLNFAATATRGPVVFEYSDAGFCNGGRHEGISRWRHGHAFPLTVQGENLEAYLAAHHAALVPRVRYLKVDAEGYDLTVLQSLAGLIDRVRPWVRAEVFKHATPATRAALFAFFACRGYRVTRLAGEGETAGAEPDLQAGDMTRWSHFDIFCTPEPPGRSPSARGESLRRGSPSERVIDYTPPVCSSCS